MKHFFLVIVLLFTINCFGQDKWNHIHEKDRLRLLHDSVSITGIVENCYQYIDGDFVIELRLDSCQELLNKTNIKKLGGLIEVEIICHHSNVFSECFGYLNDIIAPKIKDHIRVLGSYVTDKRHKWNEIHPVFKLEVLK